MNRLEETKDKSLTIYSEAFAQTYHSIHGAISESKHVFIENGLAKMSEFKTNITVFEMGFGTGLNAALTRKYALDKGLSIQYIGVEKFPLAREIYENFNTNEEDIDKLILEMHHAEWNIPVKMANFDFCKLKSDILTLACDTKIDVLYYDAFSPSAQPELWSEELFHKLYEWINPSGMLITYCAKGQVKRNLKAAGFKVESPPGPTGKREMTRAIKE